VIGRGVVVGISLSTTTISDWAFQTLFLWYRALGYDYSTLALCDFAARYAIDLVSLLLEHGGHDPVAVHRLLLGITADEGDGLAFILAQTSLVTGTGALQTDQLASVPLGQPSFCH
jgi:hypothetical protein